MPWAKTTAGPAALALCLLAPTACSDQRAAPAWAEELQSGAEPGFQELAVCTVPVERRQCASGVRIDALGDLLVTSCGLTTRYCWSGTIDPSGEGPSITIVPDAGEHPVRRAGVDRPGIASNHRVKLAPLRIAATKSGLQPGETVQIRLGGSSESVGYVLPPR